jgi:hypothetical protein
MKEVRRSLVSSYTRELRKHRKDISHLLNYASRKLLDASASHDISKYSKDERSEWLSTRKIASIPYMSDEWVSLREELIPGGKSIHYVSNDHHPEYYVDGTSGMNFVKALEMAADHFSATLRHHEVLTESIIRDVVKSNKERFTWSDDFASIMLNTMLDFFKEVDLDYQEEGKSN